MFMDLIRRWRGVIASWLLGGACGGLFVSLAIASDRFSWQWCLEVAFVIVAVAFTLWNLWEEYQKWRLKRKEGIMWISYCPTCGKAGLKYEDPNGLDPEGYGPAQRHEAYKRGEISSYGTARWCPRCKQWVTPNRKKALSRR